jgi:hypothetical protein
VARVTQWLSARTVFQHAINRRNKESEVTVRKIDPNPR